MSITAAHITGTHPYADEFPLASNDELDELTESIATVGLIHPVVITPDGLVLDGRNRLEACRRADIDPTLETREGTDDEYKEFVIGVNTTGRRESMTVQIAAASTALILGEEKRVNGQWRRNSVPSVSGGFATNWTHRMKECGFVLDVLGRDALGEVRDGIESLNAAHQKAEQARDAERNRLDREEREAAEEAEAKAFIDGNAPDLAKQVGDAFQSYAEALAVWEKRNREEAERIAKEKAAKEKAEREHKAAMTDVYSRDIGRSLSVLGGYGQWEEPAKVMDDFSPAYLSPPQVEQFYDINNLRSARNFIDALIAWKEDR